jgi:Fe-S oxidoreductase
MLSRHQQIAFLAFAALSLASAAFTWGGLYRRISAGRADTDLRLDRPVRRIAYALVTTLTQRRTFRKRPWVNFFHSFIFYGFTFYLLVNLVDAAEGFLPFTIPSTNPAGLVYNLLADLLSAAVLIGVLALVLRRFLLPSRRDFTFNRRTLLHPAIKRQSIRLDSVIVSAFILFHVGSRAIGAGAKLAAEGPDRFQPFATLLSHAFNPATAHDWRVFGYWGALGSVLAFLAYFPFSKHIHIFMAPLKYAVARSVPSGVLPALDLALDSEEPKLGAAKLEDLAWPRLLDAYACIQCNRCQDVCPATATGKALSPSALEINKRMELNDLARSPNGFGTGSPSPNPLLQFALSAEAAWACTTCGACIEVCPVQDEPMLDIIDIRRQQVMVEGAFPSQLQSAFRGMERSNNPWGISHEKRLDWAEGFNVRTTDQNPNPDVLFWVGCAASYDPQSQKTARAFVQLLDHAGVDFAVLGKKECCTGDTARRSGNEYLYRQLADRNVATLNQLNPKLIVATCPHCMNALGKEYPQIGGDYQVMHHTEYLASLVAEGRLAPAAGAATVAFHDPCYLGRHNGVYDAPRNLLNVLSNSVVELDRNRENSFCCGAGGAQFWKEEEPGDQRISDNRYKEAERKLADAEEPVLAVGCPFCKSMLESTPGKSSNGEAAIAVRDIAELLLEGVQRSTGASAASPALEVAAPALPAPASVVSPAREPIAISQAPIAEDKTPPAPPPTERKKWSPKAKSAVADRDQPPAEAAEAAAEPIVEESASVERKKWSPKSASANQPAAVQPPAPAAEESKGIAPEPSIEPTEPPA